MLTCGCENWAICRAKGRKIGTPEMKGLQRESAHILYDHAHGSLIRNDLRTFDLEQSGMGICYDYNQIEQRTEI
jgi:hypothetical protein